ncbi:hypothetical protein E7Z59_04525 [Robertkochia marina]|uniref:YtxH domain-containing protein n=1 Tax=Robertkochia marina TaxID=1227945 RepID=A0A4S3M5V5_9FLAO|nr:DUF4175 domain-containing protein [Robertkochia marina]THD69597.1 hypothetical protein E7Z59_04525 [Robertkochia marina]
MRKMLVFGVILMGVGLTTISCREKTTAEKIEDSFKDAGSKLEEAGKKLGEAGEDLGEAAEKAGEAIEKEAKKVEKDLEKTLEKIKL